MKNKYYISGVQLGILMSKDQNLKEEILQEIMGKQQIKELEEIYDLVMQGEKDFLECKHNVGDWCHHPNMDTQEECPFYWNPEECEDYKPKETGDEMSKVDKLLEKLNNHPVDNDKEFLECLIDLDYKVKNILEKIGEKEE